MTKKKTKKRKKAKKKTVAKTSPAEQVKVTPYPSAGKKITEFEEKLDEQLAAGDPDAKRGPGRPRKEAVPDPEFAMTENLIAEGIKTPFELWGLSQKLDELKLTDKEAVALANPVKLLLDHYLPNVPMIALAWASLAITTKSIMAPRLMLIAEIKKQKEPSSSSTQPADGIASTDAAGGGHGGPRSPAVNKVEKFPTKTKTVKI